MAAGCGTEPLLPGPSSSPELPAQTHISDVHRPPLRRPLCGSDEVLCGGGLLPDPGPPPPQSETDPPADSVPDQRPALQPQPSPAPPHSHSLRPRVLRHWNHRPTGCQCFSLTGRRGGGERLVHCETAGKDEAWSSSDSEQRNCEEPLLQMRYS